VLIGNKADLEEKRAVSHEEAEKKAELYKFAYVETSAKDNYNIDSCFEVIVNEIFSKYSKQCNTNAEENMSTLADGESLFSDNGSEISIQTKKTDKTGNGCAHCKKCKCNKKPEKKKKTQNNKNITNLNDVKKKKSKCCKG
jgi:GTPase SAR1 family protein